MSEKKGPCRFNLYITGDSSENHQAIQAIKKFFSTSNMADAELSIVDIMKDPSVHLKDNIIVTPTLLRITPEPRVKILGDFTDQQLMKKLLDQT